jgi:hypothetical protein
MISKLSKPLQSKIADHHSLMDCAKEANSPIRKKSLDKKSDFSLSSMSTRQPWNKKYKELARANKNGNYSKTKAANKLHLKEYLSTAI